MGGGSGSVASNEVSAVSAQAASALSQAISVLSPRTRALTGTVVVSATALTTIAGLSVSVDAGGLYQFQAMLLANRGDAAQPYGYGMDFPAMTHARGKLFVGTSVSQAVALSVQGLNVMWGGDSASGSTLVSTGSVAHLSTIAAYGGIFVVSTTGVVHLLAKASAGAAAISFLPGSYIQVFRMA
jgi:hypothetical protein